MGKSADNLMLGSFFFLEIEVPTHKPKGINGEATNFIKCPTNGRFFDDHAFLSHESMRFPVQTINPVLTAAEIYIFHQLFY